jgi:hypothetical protein
MIPPAIATAIDHLRQAAREAEALARQLEAHCGVTSADAPRLLAPPAKPQESSRPAPPQGRQRKARRVKTSGAEPKRSTKPAKAEPPAISLAAEIARHPRLPSLWAAGAATAAIAKDMGCSAPTLTKAARIAGLPARSKGQRPAPALPAPVKDSSRPASSHPERLVSPGSRRAPQAAERPAAGDSSPASVETLLRFLAERDYAVERLGDGKYRVDKKIVDAAGLLAVANRARLLMHKPPFELEAP